MPAFVSVDLYGRQDQDAVAIRRGSYEQRGFPTDAKREAETLENYLHKKMELHEGDVLEITLKQPVNVLLLTDDDYQHYGSGTAYNYHGGAVADADSAYSIAVPYTGTWNLVLDLGDKPGTIEYSIHIVRASGTEAESLRV